MHQCSAIVLILVLVGWLGVGSAQAAENTFETVFKDGFYGGLAGALVGGAVLAFSDNPEDHLNYIAYGAAVGVILGVAYGVVSATQSLAEWDGRQLAFHVPIPETAIRPMNLHPSETITSVGLLRIRF